MTDDIRLAFAHPSERAEAMDPARPLRDRISLRDHVAEVEIGAFQAERGSTQRVRFNVVVEVRPHPAPLDDDVDRVLSYDMIAEAIAAELSSERLNLLETLAERVAERILAAPQAMRAYIRIEKLDRGPGALGVEIVRDRAPDLPRPVPVAAEPEPLVAPLVVFLTNAALAAPELPGWLDRWQAGSRPLVLCVGASETPAPQATAPLVQRRIDLLAIEQNAWVLAGRDPRCVVRGSRTEIDWAMKHDQISVWAPSKIVLDAVESPSADPHDALELALWFAAELHAETVLVIGENVPEHPARGLDLRYVSPDAAGTAI
ncbi:dihydroneopterin aldolase [Rhodovulum sulfidophilum]|uniref:dihydroneopterin aldolase n=1 Tax=Rhodovulum sulfidophilum TaxID=35806 RepID=UPI00095324C6|nr:dihydroneopterin aldolase [Rhodovulum sulfidophilum]MBL3553606.1 dihydroneopterin aldolase [Rhodovulum sulfidophilum]OLS50475.1 diguanylate cyclase [Rhodovulum sulfidophilum]